MTAFKKFDPQAFLERERLAAGSANALATLATLAARPAETEISNTEVCAATTGQEEQDHNQIQSPIPAKVAKVAKVQHPASASPYQDSLDTLERRCPDFVETERWRQAVEDGRQFLATWGDQAKGLGWTAQELFGLHPLPANPHASFDRLSRYDSTGLVWLLRGRPVVKMTADSAAIRTASGGTVVYRKNDKPALGPLGDSLDDLRSSNP
jgi:hypothetical protein